VAKQRDLPGVRPLQSTVPWPPFPNTRSSPSSTASNGGDFVSARRSLLSRFALPWLSRLHALDPAFYCQTLFDSCSQIVAAGDLESNAISGSAVRENDVCKSLAFTSKHFKLCLTVFQQLSRRCDNLLRSIIKLSQNSVVFSVFDALLLRWMHSVFEMGVIDKVAFVREKHFSLLIFIFCSHCHLSTVFLSRRTSYCNCHRSQEIPLIHMSCTPHPSTH
jgi:hypothetical protein